MYVRNNESNSNITQHIKDQAKEKALHEIDSKWKFQQIAELWRDAFEPYIDTTSYKIKRADSSEITFTEAECLRLRQGIRYMKTMRSILTEIGLSKEEGDLDFLLADVVDAAENGAFLGGDRSKFSFVNVVRFNDGYDSYLQKARSGQDVYTGEMDYTKISFTKLAIESDKRVRQKKSEKELTEGAIAKIDEANVDLELEIAQEQQEKELLET